MPLGLVGVSWSPDGKMIATTVIDYQSIYAIERERARSSGQIAS
jgi:hypothetical protein